jgi:hypothetical protein
VRYKYDQRVVDHPIPEPDVLDLKVLHVLMQHDRPLKSFHIAYAVGLARGNPKMASTRYWHFYSPRHYRATMDSIIRLESAGLLVRVGPSKERTRKMSYQITDAGMSAMAA